MGTSTNGQICYGIPFEEGVEFPWQPEHGGDIELWWLYQVLNFKHSREVYDENGEYLKGKKPSREEINQYYKERRDALAANPVPVKVVNYCSDSCPMYILAVPSSVQSNSRGDVEYLTPGDLVVADSEREALLNFCQKHDIPVDSEPGWMLSSYYGA